MMFAFCGSDSEGRQRGPWQMLLWSMHTGLEMLHPGGGGVGGEHMSSFHISLPKASHPIVLSFKGQGVFITVNHVYCRDYSTSTPAKFLFLQVKNI